MECPLQVKRLSETETPSTPFLILRSRPCGVSKDGPLAPVFAAHPSRQRCALPQDEEVRKTTADGLVQGMGFTTRTSRS